MKTVKKRIATITLATIMVVTISCKGEKKGAEVSTPIENEMNDSKATVMSAADNVKAEAILSDYFSLKDALVADDNSKAKQTGLLLSKSLQSLDLSKYDNKSELKDIIEEANEQAHHISESEIENQRKHFKILSKVLIDMVAVTGTKVTLYEQYCPMYDGGSAWLSAKEEVRNPYYGSQMLTCGKVQREIK